MANDCIEIDCLGWYLWFKYFASWPNIVLEYSIYSADDKTLESYNIGAGATIHMVLQLRGGQGF